MGCGSTMTVASQPAPASSSVSVRIVMLGWCLWLLGSWAVTLTLDSPAPAARWMVFATFIGLTVVWPLFRLSQDGSVGPVEGPATSEAAKPRDTTSAATIFVDWLCLMLIFQAVIWPLSLVAHWSWRQALWLDAAIASWSLLIAAIVALAIRFESALARSAAMALCLLLVLGMPAARALAGMSPAVRLDAADDWTQGLQPIAALWQLTERSFDVHFSAVTSPVLVVAFAAVAAWIGVAVVPRLQQRA